MGLKVALIVDVINVGTIIIECGGVGVLCTSAGGAVSDGTSPLFNEGRLQDESITMSENVTDRIFNVFKFTFTICAEDLIQSA